MESDSKMVNTSQVKMWHSLFWLSDLLRFFFVILAGAGSIKWPLLLQLLLSKMRDVGEHCLMSFAMSLKCFVANEVGKR